ncbi:MAG: albusnodin/ikarugamycin family macrolactam cyclase [Egibacteraceae bacterium]
MGDSVTGQRIAAELLGRATQVIAHPSGRPWLFGSWSPTRLLTVTCGHVQAVMLGACLVSRQESIAEVGRAVNRGTYDGLACLPGSFHLLVSQPAGVTAYTDPAGLRQLFYATYGSTVICGSHTRVLNALTSAAVDEAWLVSRLVCPGLPHVRKRWAPFRGVRPVPPGYRLTVAQDGTATVARYWSVPADTRSLTSSAPQLREQLTGAVHGRVRVASRVTSDLSGGLDSTSLSFLAARSAKATGASLCTLTFPAASPANDDLQFARAAVASQPEAQHMFVDPSDYPLPFQDLSNLPPLDEPASFAMNIARVRHVARMLAGLGSQVHLKGEGGDAVLLAPPAYLHAAMRRHPLVAVGRVRMHAALQRQPAIAFLSQVARPCSYRRWLLMTARGLERAASQPDLGLGWSIAPDPPGWMTQDTLAAALDILTDAAAGLEPLAPDPGQHAAMERILVSAETARLYRDAMAGMGVDVECPYLDAGVVETCLATRAHERTDPSRAKPLLAAAVEGLVPEHVLVRRTKGHYDTDLHLGLRRHRDELIALLDGSELAARGLIDSDALRAAIHRLAAGGRGSLAQLSDTLACELWLRTLGPGPAEDTGPRRDRSEA